MVSANDSQIVGLDLAKQLATGIRHIEKVGQEIIFGPLLDGIVIPSIQSATEMFFKFVVDTNLNL